MLMIVLLLLPCRNPREIKSMSTIKITNPNPCSVVFHLVDCPVIKIAGLLTRCEFTCETKADGSELKAFLNHFQSDLARGG